MSAYAYFEHKAAIRAYYERLSKGQQLIEDRDENGVLWRVRAKFPNATEAGWMR